MRKLGNSIADLKKIGIRVLETVSAKNLTFAL
jgi:hypothetical protein